VRQILTRLFEHGAGPPVTNALPGLSESAELNQRGATRFLWRQAAGSLLLGCQFDVSAQLLIQIAVDLPLPNEVPEQAGEPCAHGHGLTRAAAR
jgi:hypothetical protein